MCVCHCESSKNTVVTVLPLEIRHKIAIYILRKMPAKPGESSVECYGHGFPIAAPPIRTLR